MPAGLFLPGILIGCGLGHFVGEFVRDYITSDNTSPTYAIMGAAGILSGYSRLSFSLTVLMMETTVNVNLFLPTLITVLASLWGGELLTRSLYVEAIRSKNIPFLVERCPRQNRIFRAKDLMNSPVKYISASPKVGEVYELLTTTKHCGFPVVEEDTEQVRGLMTRNQLVSMIKHGCFSKERLADQSFGLSLQGEAESPRYTMALVDGSRTLSWEDFNTNFHSSTLNIMDYKETCDEHYEEFLNVGPFMNWKPFVVGENTELQKLLSIFRLMNLRHLPVTANEDGRIKGMLTRKDIFKYLEL